MKTTVTWTGSPVADCVVPLVNLVVPAQSYLDGAQIQPSFSFSSKPEMYYDRYRHVPSFPPL